MTDSEKKRKGLALTDMLLQEAEMFEDEFHHLEMARESRFKALGALAVMRDMGLLSVQEYRIHAFRATEREKKPEE